MGSGIAQAAAAAGFPTVVHDLSPELLARGRVGMQRSLDKLVEKERIPPGVREAALERLAFSRELVDLRDSDIIIEAVTEDLDAKNALWRELDALCPPETVFASNTSSLPIAAMAAATGRPQRFIGLHFFNPVPLMPLVEVVRTVTTSDETMERAFTFVRALGKEAVSVADRSGFLVNLLLVPYLLDAVRALERGVASIADVDRAMRLGAGHPMGPLTLLDFIGLDTAVRIGDIMFEEYRDARYAPAPLLRRMVTLGLLGQKSGRGFYDYAADPPVPMRLGL